MLIELPTLLVLGLASHSLLKTDLAGFGIRGLVPNIFLNGSSLVIIIRLSLTLVLTITPRRA